jgi:hypothetical protein
MLKNICFQIGNQCVGIKDNFSSMKKNGNCFPIITFVNVKNLIRFD